MQVEGGAGAEALKLACCRERDLCDRRLGQRDSAMGEFRAVAEARPSGTCYVQ